MLCYGKESRWYRVPVVYSNGIQFGEHDEAYPHAFDDNELPSRRNNEASWRIIDSHFRRSLRTRLSDIGRSKGWIQLSNMR